MRETCQSFSVLVLFLYIVTGNVQIILFWFWNFAEKIAMIIVRRKKFDRVAGKT